MAAIKAGRHAKTDGKDATPEPETTAEEEVPEWSFQARALGRKFCDTRTRTRTRTHARTRMHTLTHTHTRMRARAHAHKRTHTHTHAHAYAHTHVRVHCDYILKYLQSCQIYTRSHLRNN